MNWAGFGRARTEQAYLAEPALLSPHSTFQRAPGPEVRASPKVLGMRSCTVKLDEENQMYASLAHENGFGSCARGCWFVVARIAKPCPLKQ